MNRIHAAPGPEMTPAVAPGVEPGLDLGFGDLWDLLGRRKWIVFGLALVVTAASLYSASRQETTYTSEASVVVASSAETSVEAQQVLTTEKRLAGSRAVAAIVVRDLKLQDSVDDVLGRLSIGVPLNTQLIEFRYTAVRPQTAERLAQAFVQAYVRYQARILDGLVASYRSIDQLADALRLRLANAQASANQATDPAAVAAAEVEIDALTDQLARVERQRTTLLTSSLIASTIAERASPAVQNEPPLKRAGVAGLLAGLVLGSCVALAVDYSSRGRREARRNRRRLRP